MKIIILSFISLWGLLSFEAVFCQTLSVNGKIIDNETLFPLPYCNIIDQSGKGVITNSDGKFKIYTQKNSTIKITHIGYFSETIVVKDQQSPLTIRMVKNPVQIDEVVILDEDTLKTFLSKVFDKIEDNYSTEPVNLIGFYREEKNINKDSVLYFGEAILKLYKGGYKRFPVEDQVKIVSSRKKEFEINMELNKVRFYAGAFIPVNFDFVKQRADFIHPTKYKHYDYTVGNTTVFDGRTVIPIHFDTNGDTLRGSEKGVFYIDVIDLAYIGADFERTPRGLRAYNSLNLGPYKGTRRSYTVRYRKLGTKWYLNNCTIDGESLNESTNIHINDMNEYVTTEIITDSVEPFEYNDRLGYHDIFLDEADPYELSDLDSVAVIMLPESIINQVNSSEEEYTTSEKVNRVKLIGDILQRFQFEYGINNNYLNDYRGDYSFMLGNNNFSKSFENTATHITLESRVYYQLAPRWHIGYESSSLLGSNDSYAEYGLGIMYSRVINKVGRPLFIEAGMYGYSDFIGLNMGKVPETIHIGKHSYNNKYTAYIGSRNYGIKPFIKLSYTLRPMVAIYISCNSSVVLSDKVQLNFVDESRLFTKNNFEKVHTDVYYNGEILDDLSSFQFKPYGFGGGLIIKF